MADVFISYAREDRPRADQIARGLQAMGLECFWDSEIPPGQTWADYTESKLNACKAVVVLWSEHSTKSHWVREEARMGRDRSKLIPAMIDGVQMPFGFGEVQAANLANWRGDTNYPEWRSFAGAVYAAARDGAAAPQQPSHAPMFVAAQDTGASASSPLDYIKKCLRLFANGSGRARRSEMAWFLVFVLVAMFVGAFIDLAVFGLNPYTGEANAYMFTLLAYLALLCPLTAVASRRAHDFGQTGWWAALAAVPSFGLAPALIYALIPGQAGANKYGPDPKAV